MISGPELEAYKQANAQNYLNRKTRLIGYVMIGLAMISNAFAFSPSSFPKECDIDPYYMTVLITNLIIFTIGVFNVLLHPEVRVISLGVVKTEGE